MRAIPILLALLLCACSKPKTDDPAPSTSSATAATTAPKDCAKLLKAFEDAREPVTAKGGTLENPFGSMATAAERAALAMAAFETTDPAAALQSFDCIQIFRDIAKAARAANLAAINSAADPNDTKKIEETGAALLASIKKMNEHHEKLKKLCAP